MDDNSGNKEKTKNDIILSAADELSGIDSSAAIDFLVSQVEEKQPVSEETKKLNAKQKELDDIIRDLSKDSKLIDNSNEVQYIDKFIAVYTDENFRHSYSELTRIIFKCNESENENENALHTLTINLQYLYEYVESNFSESEACGAKLFVKSFRKLYDHFNLEITRLGFIKQIKETYENSINDANRKVQAYKNEISEFQESLNETISTYESKMAEQKKSVRKLQKIVDKYDNRIDKKLSSSTIQSITILSIFAATVFAFTGGLNLISSAFNNIDKVTIYRFTFTILLIGFILFNTIFGLLYSIAKISGKEISRRCMSCKDTCPCSNECSPIRSLRRRYPLIYYMNIAILLLFMAIFFSWSIQSYRWPEYLFNNIEQLYNK